MVFTIYLSGILNHCSYKGLLCIVEIFINIKCLKPFASCLCCRNKNRSKSTEKFLKQSKKPWNFFFIHLNFKVVLCCYFFPFFLLSPKWAPLLTTFLTFPTKNLLRKVDFSCFYAYGYVLYVVLNHKKLFVLYVVLFCFYFNFKRQCFSLSHSLTHTLSHFMLLCVPMFFSLYHQRRLFSTKVKLNFIFHKFNLNLKLCALDIYLYIFLFFLCVVFVWSENICVWVVIVVVIVVGGK